MLFFLFTDQLGSMNVTSDQNGLMVSLSRYKPWGGSRGGAGTTLTDYAFTGQRKISYIKLDWYGSRKKNSCRPFQFKRGFETPAETILERRPGTLEAWKQLFNSNPSRRVSKMNDALCSEVSIETLAPMRVACYRAASLSPEEDGAKFMLDRWNQQSGAAPGRRFGFDVAVTPEEQKEGLRGYEIWLVAPPEVQPSAGVTLREFAGGLYAVQTQYDPFVDPFGRIPAGWKALHEWVIESSECRSGEHQWLEEIVRGAAEDGREDLKLYHPIQMG